jgi:exodeoxyribonuclease V alpha subunit
MNMPRTVVEDIYAPVDIHFARMMLAMVKETDAVVAQTLKHLFYRARHGDVCVNPGHPQTRQRILTGNAAPLSAQEIISRLSHSRLIGNGGDNAPLVLDDSGRLYLQRFWQTQERLVSGIVQRSAPPSQPRTDPVAYACDLAETSAFMAITGGPGAGKTTLAATILSHLLSLNSSSRICACAPTGKAAMRLKEAILRCAQEERLTRVYSGDILNRLPGEVTTIHRLLSPIGSTGRFRYNRERKLPADVILLDEASMVDLELMTAVFDAVSDDAKIILLGDQYQLSSIEPGRVLGDICYGATLETPGKNAHVARCIVSLTGSHRFQRDSGIARLADAVNAGDPQKSVSIATGDGFSDVNFVNLRNPDAPRLLAELAASLYLDGIRSTEPAEKLAHLDAARILSPVNYGPFGVHAINRMVASHLAENGWIDPDGEVYEHKPILISKNDYGVSLFNGDTGVICSEGNRLWACFGGPDTAVRKLPVSVVRYHLPAYATTVHKAQGSEFDHIVLVLPETESPILTRELFYTAITRAKRKLTIFTTPETISQCTANPTQRTFATGHRLWTEA